MSPRTRGLGAAALLAVLVAPHSPLLAGLAPGDDAPPLEVTKWVKGEPVGPNLGGGKQVVVLEFWATWCGPCIASMPHLTEVQKKYADRGVVIVGVTRPDRSNSLEKVESFVAEKGEGMGYRVAFDGDAKTYAAYMTAAGQRGIPTSFIVDREGKLAWIGHPMRMDGPLEKIVAGTFDVELAAIGTKLNQRMMRLMRAGDTEGATRALDALLALDPTDSTAHRMRFSLLLRAEKSAEALEAAREASKCLDDASALALFAANVLRLEGVDGAAETAVLLARRAVEVDAQSERAHVALLQALLATESGREEALRVAKAALERASDDAALLNSIAWTLLTEGEPTDAAARTALEAALRCDQLTKGESWMYIDTLALARFRTGDPEEAVRLQRKAMDMAREAKAPPAMLSEFEERLEEYEAGQTKKPVRL